MLTNGKYSLDGEGRDAILKTKRKVYDNIVEYLDIEGYPNFKEANVSDLVYAIISPILFDFKSRTGRKELRLEREKEIISTDNETGGTEEFVVIDRISVGEEKYVLIIEAKKGTRGVVYGFITTGEFWRMLRYDGTFQMRNKIEVLFDTADEEKERWMKENSVLVDCIYVALSNGGIAQK